MAPRRAAALRGGEQSLREHLVAAARALVARCGTAGLTVRDIAGEAGVADGVLYNHFADKEELLAHALHAHVRAVEAELDGVPPRPGEGTVAANLRAYLERSLALHAAILPAFAGLTTQPKLLARLGDLPTPLHGGQGLRADLAGYLRAEQGLGRVAASASPEAVATLVVGVCHDLVLGRLLDPSGPPPEPSAELVDALVATLLHGVLPGD
ncbi:TetR/AcrR family transcriptional regulator [Micromonospora sp. DR5-3]|uniref:TetR/AcrR family transcriptional regulator n=1 Tax=unclassified Micromonospora TaxID=2617518 RepID=UPI0011D64271|nr:MULTISPECIES: TetR/AcrR family transcriptional regulator [unclassified Micromonospora]MCW3817501.1 TetR/AcrR family transcriptional regulator [Micromonospora sp. DR5-3]TYC25215.1 helix-turn-helix transcriptional regulator [Micromonospora sp. MP36]